MALAVVTVEVALTCIAFVAIFLDYRRAQTGGHERWAPVAIVAGVLALAVGLSHALDDRYFWIDVACIAVLIVAALISRRCVALRESSDS